MPINADKPLLWKDDIRASVDQFNQWFMVFAPKAFREARLKTTEDVEKSLRLTKDLTAIDAVTIAENPQILPTLRMSTCPPLARDRLVGLAYTSKNLIYRMEEGAVPRKLAQATLQEHLGRVSGIISKMLDRDIFPWLALNAKPTKTERHRASTIVADRLCGAVAQDILRSARKIQQLSALSGYLNSRGYLEVVDPGRILFEPGKPGTYSFFINMPVALGKDALHPVDTCVNPIEPRADGLPVLVQAESHPSFVHAMRRRSAHRSTWRALRMTYGDGVPCSLLLDGYCNGDYLGTQAAEGIDWVWQHRLADLEALGV